MVAPADADSPEVGSGRFVVDRYHRRVVGSVTNLLERMHFTGAKLDNTMSERWFDEYLAMLDPQRDIFLQADVERFSRHRDDLDNYAQAHPPKITLAVEMYEKYQKRQRVRAMYAISALGRPLDLTNAEALPIDRHDTKPSWPTTDEEANEFWRKRVENDVIIGLLDGRDDEETVRKRLASRYQRWLRDEGEKEATDVLQEYLTALGQAYDPHSEWFAPQKNDQFDISITNSVEGIGASLQQDDQGYTVVKEVVRGGPASRDERIKKEDRILAVAQADGEPVDVVEMRLDKVVALIRGPKGTSVVLHLQHADGTMETVTLQRDRVVLEDQRAEGHVEEVLVPGPDGASTTKKLGVLDLPTFYIDFEGRRNGRGASEDVARQVLELQQQGVEGLLLDLRSNGGGSLTEAVEVAGLFLPGGPVVQVRYREGQVETLHDHDPSVVWAGPLVVLVDAYSASASEIVAGALQDYGRAVIVGDQSTHGKGTVQQVINLDDSGSKKKDEVESAGALKVTVQKFYRVSGGSTQIRGIASDVVLPSVLDGFDEIHEAGLDYPLPWDQIPPAPHVRTGTPEKVVAELSKRSAARVAEDEDFRKLRDAMALREKVEAEREVSLVLEDRRADQKTREALLGLEDEPDLAGLSEDEIDALRRKQDYRLDEGLQVLADYVQLVSP